MCESQAQYKNSENFMDFENVCGVDYMTLQSLSCPGKCKATAD